MNSVSPAVSSLIMSPVSNSVSPMNPSYTISPNVDDGLTSLSWLQNLNMCMTRLGAPTPPTPPASPIWPNHGHSNMANGETAHNSASNLLHHGIYSNHHREKTNHPVLSSSKKSIATDEETIDYKTNGSVKPPYSYATLICMAMKANKNKMTLSAIYKWIHENFLYYKNADPSWQNSIRHNLSLNKCFIKIPRSKDEPGKGGFWRLDPVYGDTLVDGVFKKRRPSQRCPNGTNINNTSAPFRKKPRKRDLRNEQTLPAINGLKNGPAASESPVMHDTPPSSAESYNHPYGETQNDAVELATAVSSIETVGHCPAYSSYAIQTHQEQPQLSHHGFSDEVCITSTPTDTCMLAPDGNDICWNAILTDADLGELVDPSNYVGPVSHAGDTTPSSDTTTTAQLTAVEPHSLQLVDAELFQPRSARHLVHGLTRVVGSGNPEVISATHNVVTCMNPSGAEWDAWATYAPTVTVTSNNSDNNQPLLIHHIGTSENSRQSTGPRPSIMYVATGTPCPHPHLNNAVVAIAQPSSPSTNAPFDNHNSLQPWAECKAALEAAALDLEDTFGDIETAY